MPRIWFSGPRLFNGLLRPGISFSGRELASWRKKAPKVSEDATLGICRRPNGNYMLAIPGMNGDAEHEPGLEPVAAFFFSRVDGSRRGTKRRPAAAQWPCEYRLVDIRQITWANRSGCQGRGAGAWD